MNISLSLRLAFARSGKRQTAMVKEIGIAPSYLSEIVNGHKHGSVQFVDQAASFFGMKVSEFIALGED